MQQQNIQAQAQANQQSQQVAAQIEMQKNQAKFQGESQLEQLKAQLEFNKLQQEIAGKKELMQLEFQMNQQIQGMQQEQLNSKETMKEDRKDERTRIQASQQSDLIEQRKTGNPPKNFESSGNDILGDGIGIDDFNPR